MQREHATVPIFGSHSGTSAVFCLGMGGFGHDEDCQRNADTMSMGKGQRRSRRKCTLACDTEGESRGVLPSFLFRCGRELQLWEGPKKAPALRLLNEGAMKFFFIPCFLRPNVLVSHFLRVPVCCISAMMTPGWMLGDVAL